MTRRESTPKMDSPTARAKNCRKELVTYWEVISEGCSLGYRHGARGGVWYAKLYFPGESQTRRQKTLGRADDLGVPAHVETISYSQAKESVTAWYRETALSLKEPIREVRNSYTIRQCMEDYMQRYVAAGKRAEKDTRRAIEAHILPVFGECRVEDLKVKQIRDWHEKLALTPPRVRTARSQEQQYKDISKDPESGRRRRSTANRILTILKAALNQAVRDELADPTSTPWTLVKPFSGADESRARWLSIEQQKRLVGCCPPDFGKLVQGALHCGARYGELARLCVRDFDAAHGFIRIQGLADNKKGRIAFLAPEGVEFFKSMVTGRGPSELIFMKEDGSPWGKTHQKRDMDKAAFEAGLEPGFTFHGLRHTYASIRLETGMQLSVLADQLGHIGTRMIEKHYGHLSDEHRRDQIRSQTPQLGLGAVDSPGKAE